MRAKKIANDYGVTLMLIVGIDDLPESQALSLKTKYPEENKTTFFYAHLNEIIVANNNPVKAGDRVDAQEPLPVSHASQRNASISINPPTMSTTQSGLITIATHRAFR